MMPSDVEAAWFAEMEDANPDGIMILQGIRAPSGGLIDFSWIYANPAAAGIVRRPAAELVGRRLLVEMSGDMNGGLFDAYVRVVETGQPFTHEFHSAHDGLEHWFQNTTTRFRDGLIIRFADITQKLQMEQELRARAEEARHESEQRLRLTLEAARMGIWDDVLPDGERKWDARCREFFGLSPDEPVELERIFSLVHPEDRARVHAAAEATFTRGEPFSVEHRVRSARGGPERWVAAMGRVQPDASGQRLRFTGIMADITERRIREEELRRMADFEQQLLGIVGHDLRNPLTAIRSSAALLESRLTDERSARALARIVSSTKRATRIIHDLLDLTHARLGGGIPIQPGPANIHALVRRIVEEHEASYPARRLELAQRGPGDGTWDSTRLEQVFANLLSNALSYSPEGSPVRIETDGLREEVRVLVHNEGPPIPQELMPHLFQPFKRTHHEVERRGSMGLGLFIVEQVIRGHGGRIEVNSTSEEGTRFTVWLPRTPGEREQHGPS